MAAPDAGYRALLERVKAILATLPRADLEELRAHLDDILPSEGEIVRVTSAERAEPAPGRVTRREERVRCGKERCRCRAGALHGPYVYFYWREGGRLRKKYGGVAGPRAPRSGTRPGGDGTGGPEVA